MSAGLPQYDDVEDYEGEDRDDDVKDGVEPKHVYVEVPV